MKCEDNDLQLITRVADHDRIAFELLYYRYADRIMRFLHRQFGASELHEEITNEVMVVIWQRAADFRQTTRLSTWIFGIARRKAAEAYRRFSRVPPKLLTHWREDCTSEDLESRALQTEHLERIKMALDRLPPDQRATLILAFYHNCSQREIAERTGYPVSTVKSQIRQGLRRLKCVLKPPSAVSAV